MEIQKHSESKTRALTQSKSPSTALMGQVLAILKGGYPNQSMTPETAELYLREFSVICREVGQPLLESAVRAAIRESKFFPTIAEIREKIKFVPKPNDTLDELQELKEREASGEKFYGWADVLNAAKDKGINPDLKPMPNVRTVFPDIDPDKNREKLEKQRKELL